MKTIQAYLFWLFFLIAYTIVGQSLKKRPVTPQDYSQWHTMLHIKISDDGNWATYNFAYEGKRDSTFVQEIKSKRRYSFPQSSDNRLNNDWFSCIQESNLQLLHLKSHKLEKIASVSRYSFAQNNWVVLFLNKNSEALLIIKDSKGKERYRFENIQQYFLSPSGSTLLLHQKRNATSTLSLVPLDSGKPEYVTNVSNDPVMNVTWDKQEKVVAFFDQGANSPTLYLYRRTPKELFQLQKEGHWNDEISTDMTQTSLVENGSKLLFWTKKKQLKEEVSFVNIWHAQDDVLQVRRKKYPHVSKTLGIWQIDKDTIQLFQNKDLSDVATNGRFALRNNSQAYMPSTKLEPDADYYLEDLITGEVQLLLKGYGMPRSITLLPDGKSLLYFKASNWWRYTIKTATHENLTHQLAVSFVNDAFEQRDTDYPIASPILADDGSAILLYDTHDIWQLDSEGKNPIRLTKGKEKNQIYRVAEVELTANKNPVWMINTGKTYQSNTSLLLSVRAIDYSEYGFGWLEPKKEFKALHTEPKRIEIIAKRNKDLVFTTQSFDSPSQLLYWEHKKQNAIPIVQSNPQHEKYAWGHTKTIYYTNNSGEPLQGVLFYPADYDAKKKYPMVVSIYQKRGYERHNYSNPSFYNAIGFNVSNLSSKGYFVLFPDISYEINNPGYSALDCVMAAVKSALTLKAIDETNVALVGHSFGGYETNFIVTQTSFFKTAIASAGVTDFTSRYFSISENHTAPETWRFEYQQQRMKGSLFKYRTEYRSNSPIEHVEHINTPLLTWTGEKDTQVNPYQSMEFYIALRRLKRQHIMLSYVDEGHVILNQEKQKDLTIKMEAWLDYYLKNGVKPSWMEVNYQYQTH